MTVDPMTVQRAAQALRQNVGRVIVGQERAIELEFVALLVEGHVLIEDVPGIGKTTLAKAVARSLGCAFQRTQFTPDLLPGDITGVGIYNPKSEQFEYRPGPVVTNVLLADEINRATPRAQSPLLLTIGEAPLVSMPESPVSLSVQHLGGADAWNHLAIVVFLLTGWATLALASVAEAASITGASGGLALSRYWMLAVATAIAVIFLAGLVVAGVVTPAAVSRLLAYLLPLVQVPSRALGYMIYVVAYVTFLLISPLFYWLRSLMHTANGQPDTSPPLQPPSKLLLDPGAAAPRSPLAEFLLRGAILLGMVLLIDWVLAWALRRSSRTDEQGVRESRELIWSWDLWRARWAELMARRTPPLAFVTLSGSPDDPLVWVRTAYRRLLVLALEHGRPRQPGQTPLGYLPSLDEVWPAEAPGVAAGLAAVTTAYDAARYGDQPPRPDELEALRQKVEQVLASRVAPGAPKHEQSSQRRRPPRAAP